VYGAENVAIPRKERVGEYYVEDFEVFGFVVAVADIGRNYEKVAALDGKSVVLYVVRAAPLGDNVYFVELVRVHAYRKVVLMKVAKQHGLLLLFGREKIVCLESFAKGVNIARLYVFGLFHKNMIAPFYNKIKRKL
jgi:hypothetical protein